MSEINWICENFDESIIRANQPACNCSVYSGGQQYDTDYHMIVTPPR
jgi:hypothetical protein